MFISNLLTSSTWQVLIKLYIKHKSAFLSIRDINDKKGVFQISKLQCDYNITFLTVQLASFTAKLNFLVLYFVIEKFSNSDITISLYLLWCQRVVNLNSYLLIYSSVVIHTYWSCSGYCPWSLTLQYTTRSCYLPPTPSLPPQTQTQPDYDRNEHNRSYRTSNRGLSINLLVICYISRIFWMWGRGAFLMACDRRFSTSNFLLIQAIFLIGYKEKQYRNLKKNWYRYNKEK